MPHPRTGTLALAAALALAGCVQENYDRAARAGAPSASSGSVALAMAPAAGQTEPTAGNAAAEPTVATTFVGQKAQALRQELNMFQGNLAQHQQALQAARDSAAQNAQGYFGTVATINARLQAGTTPGNPELVAQWSRAQVALDQIGNDIAKLNTISNEAAADSSFGNYVLNEVRAAYNLQGGVDADRDQLHQIENGCIASLAQVDQLLNNLSQEISRQGTYVSNERNNLVTLALAIQNGQLYGPSLANRSFATAPGSAPAAAPRTPVTRQGLNAPQHTPAAAVADDRPLVVIRFDRPDVAYEQPLYTAVSRALERKPGAAFTIQAVAPNQGTAAEVAVNSNASRQNAENVLRSLTNMGLPADRVSLSATMSPDVQSNEVRIFVR